MPTREDRSQNEELNDKNQRGKHMTSIVNIFGTIK
jgi:hypothetical protein